MAAKLYVCCWVTAGMKLMGRSNNRKSRSERKLMLSTILAVSSTPRPFLLKPSVAKKASPLRYV